MGKLILRWILLAVSVYAASLLTQALGLGFRTDTADAEGVGMLFVGVVVLAFVNATLGRVLKVLTLPLSCITLGLFSLVVNAVLLMVVASFRVGFLISDDGPKAFLTAFVASVLISVINGVLGVFLPDDND